MSTIFVQRLRGVRKEFEACRESLLYVSQNWDRFNIVLKVEDLTPKHFSAASENIETVFIIRLFSVFEGVLKEHLAKSHPGIVVAEDAKAIWLINRVANRQTPHISAPLVQATQSVRNYRNFLVHPGGQTVATIHFIDALSILAKFCDKLPDPPR